MADNDLEDNIVQLQQFTDNQLNEQQCRQLLRTNNNDTMAALNQFYDRGLTALQDETWDNSAWDADRYGQTGNSTLPSFNIESAPEYPPGANPYPRSAAPSRPPSRSSHRSAVDSAMGDVVLSSVENDQESGVIGAQNKPVFGPATREYYDNASWSLVPSSSAVEFIPDVAASNRKREENGPAILKPLSNADYLPALLTILHSIPLFRHALLAPELAASDYGGSTEWWKGSPIAQARAVEYGIESSKQEDLDLIYETQRIMAFLDSTERAYATVQPLTQLRAFTRINEGKDSWNALPDFHAFLMAWSQAYQSQIPDADLNGKLRTVVNAVGQNQESWFLDAEVKNRTDGKPMTLYDVLDDHLFSVDSGNASVVKPSNILIMRLAQSSSDPKLGVQAPPTFYADRYLESNATEIQHMFQAAKKHEKEIETVNARIRKLKYHRDPKTGKELAALNLMKTSMKVFEQKEGDLIEDPKNAALLEQLQSLFKSVESKLKVLEEQKEKARKALDVVTGLYKGPMNEPAASPSTATNEVRGLPVCHMTEGLKAPYTLRGVSTIHDTVYLLHPDITSDVLGAMQWWKVQYMYNGSDSYILREKVTEQNVIQNIYDENNSALLVYANEAALNHKSDPLPEALDKFVKRDNYFFLEELQQENETNDSWGPSVHNAWDTNNNRRPPTYRNEGSNPLEPSWDTDTKRYEDMSGAEWLRSQNQGSEVSSSTLTPNTETTEVEMREVDSGSSNSNFKPDLGISWPGTYAMPASHPNSNNPYKDSLDQQNIKTSETQSTDISMADVDDRSSQSIPPFESHVLGNRQGGQTVGQAPNEAHSPQTQHIEFTEEDVAKKVG